MKTIVGIDFSLTSTGITIKRSSEHVFMSFINKRAIKKNSIAGEILNLVKANEFTNPVNSLDKKDPFGVTKWQRKTMLSANMLSELIMGALVVELENDTDVFFAFENYITKNGGNQTIQIIEHTFSLKDKIGKKYGAERCFFYPAPTIKKFAGGGGYTKQDMFRSFLSTAPDSKFKSFVFKNTEHVIVGDKDVVPPVSDLVDSFFVAELLARDLHGL